MKAANSKVVTAAILHQVENIDSDGDGWTNGEEIAAGTLPGDPNSHPSGAPPHTATASADAPAGTGGAAGAASGGAPSLFPLHSFHPLIVHFPIALCLFGGFLEYWGVWKRRAELREAGFCCLIAAAVASVAAVATGFTAFFRNGFPFQGIYLIHMILGVSAAIAMVAGALVGRAAARRGRERIGPAYWIALTAALAAVAAAGYFGGLIVYGS